MVLIDFVLKLTMQSSLRNDRMCDRYSPNIKEIKVLDKKKVRRAKLYYLRDKMNALKKQ